MSVNQLLYQRTSFIGSQSCDDTLRLTSTSTRTVIIEPAAVAATSSPGAVIRRAQTA